MDRMIPLTASVEVLAVLANSVGVDEEEVDNERMENENDILDDGSMPLRLHGDDSRGSDSEKDDGEMEKKRYTVQEQRDVIRKIHESNQILKQELSIEWREAKAMLGAEKQAKLKRLQKQSTSYSHKIEQEKRAIKKLEESVAARHRELQHLREENVRNDKLESVAAATRRNRLEISLVKKNEVDSINKHLRQQIDKVRRDRIVFDGIYKKLERETCEFRHRLEGATADLAKSIAAKEQIDKEVQDLQALVESEQITYEKEFKELREAAEQARAIELAPEAEVVSGQLSSDQESSIHRTSALSSWKIAYDKAISTASNAEALRYQQMFEKIYQETGIPDAEKLAQEDEDNFKKFKHVETLHKETDDLRVEIEKMTAALDAYKLQEGIGTNVLDKATYRALTAKLTAVEETNQRLDAEFDEMGVRLARVKATVHSLFTMLNQKSSETGQGGAAVHGVSLNDITDSNMLEYLQVVEKSILSLLHHGNNGGATHGPHVLAETSPFENAKKFKQSLEPPSCHDLTGATMPTARASGHNGASAARTSSRVGTPTTHRHNLRGGAGDGVEEEERALTYDELKESAQAAFATSSSGHKHQPRATARVTIQTPPTT
ncbi:hypothetical protein DYB32_003207 [Aphanomyces invadans]|uniref:ODAD1 central coiled coil region domain-containing protein n=1 Tax=Aphanomyces invadans TaxID=157072 RepID=A0A418B145_9STRA|nr:hypothetical protein DYB32_003207 [Aphanomyces invadans]